VAGDVGVEGTPPFEAEKRRESARGDAPTPVLLADPVSHLALAGLHEAHDVAGYLALEENRLLDDGLIVQNPVPVREERFPASGGKAGQTRRPRLELVFEEREEIGFLHVPQQDAASRWSPCAYGHAVLPGLDDQNLQLACAHWEGFPRLVSMVTKPSTLGKMYWEGPSF
jgi:hypothetical protein